MWVTIFRALLAAIARAGAVGARVVQAGRIAFVGLIRNRPLTELTQQEIRNALAQTGMREAHNAHFVSRLIERGGSFGLNTLDDFANAFNNGVATAGRDGTTVVELAGSGARVILNKAGEFVTLTGRNGL